MGLLKDARGLPRFQLDCGFWRHPRWTGARLDQIGLFAACLSYCYEHETDGYIPGPHPEDLALALGLRTREVRPALAGLLLRGSLAAHDAELEVVAFEEHNPTRAQIHEHREKRSAAGKKGAEVRWQEPSDSDTDANANRMTHRIARVEKSREEKLDLQPSTASRAPNPHFDALVELFGKASTKERASFYGKSVKSFKDAGIEPAEMLTRGRVMFAKGWEDCSPMALLKHWDALAPVANGRGRVNFDALS